MNLTKGIVRQFAQHYRADQPQILKRAELFRGVQRALADAFPKQIRALLERSRDGIRVIADAHIEWLDVRGIPLGIRYNVSRIPVTPGNLFIDTLSNLPFLYLTPDDFRDILIISGLRDGELIAEQFRIAFDIFGGEWRDTLRIQFVRVASRRELVDAINRFQGVLMVFDGHGSHNSSEPGLLWLGDESVDVWTLREELVRVPPIVILSACDTHAADRNHATVANGFLSLGCRSVLGSVFPLDAFQAAIFTARLLRRVSIYIPAAIKGFRRSLTWLEVVSGMLRHQAATDIILQLERSGFIEQGRVAKVLVDIIQILDSDHRDPFSHIHQTFIEAGICEQDLNLVFQKAIAASSAISYLQLGRPETILMNTRATLELIDRVARTGSQTADTGPK